MARIVILTGFQLLVLSYSPQKDSHYHKVQNVSQGKYMSVLWVTVRNEVRDMKYDKEAHYTTIEE